MVKNHIKRLAAPNTWPIERKKYAWVARPYSGTHRLHHCMPISFVLKEVLSYAKTAKEAKQILNTGKILIDAKIRKKPKYPLGLFDVLSVDGDNYRMLLNLKGKLFLHPIKSDEAMIKPRKIVRKYVAKGGRLCITTYDGTTQIVKVDYNTDDTLIFDLAKNEIKEHLNLEKGSLVYIIGGKQVGKVGIIQEIKQAEGLQSQRIAFTVGEKSFETLKEYAFVIGKTKPVISLP